MIDKSVIVACLKKDNYNRVSNLIKKDYFPKEIGTIIDVINKLHKKYDNDISLEDVMLSHRDSFPAMPEATRLRVERDINSLFTVKVQDELVADILHNFWKRTKAKQIGEQALDIFLGKSGDTSPLLSSVEDLKNNEVKLSNTYSVLNEDIETSLNEFEREPEFKFPSQIRDYVTGIDRQNLGVIFARPEIGKTSFAAWLCGWYVKNNLNVAYWGNEEPVRKTRMRVAKSILELSRQEILLDKNKFIEKYKSEVLPYATFHLWIVLVLKKKKLRTIAFAMKLM